MWYQIMYHRSMKINVKDNSVLLFSVHGSLDSSLSVCYLMKHSIGPGRPRKLISFTQADSLSSNSPKTHFRNPPVFRASNSPLIFQIRFVDLSGSHKNSVSLHSRGSSITLSTRWFLFLMQTWISTKAHQTYPVAFQSEISGTSQRYSVPECEPRFHEWFLIIDILQENSFHKIICRVPMSNAASLSQFPPPERLRKATQADLELKQASAKNKLSAQLAKRSPSDQTKDGFFKSELRFFIDLVFF